ncbi:uncharacterized protein LOC111393935 isoform X4 [Olea europaea var. sylvestris]|uniref:uncharacterized protein LOC111393935 isoform X4 n=1 Tax=Olea europaea var. sylvestris TaxID=158386 RepID=UPI000C1CE5C7|nr:uncharacterized protein LOC111393935 isoform X4 [Olea europaea var. sylvestris]
MGEKGRICPVPYFWFSSRIDYYKSFVRGGGLRPVSKVLSLRGNLRAYDKIIHFNQRMPLKRKLKHVLPIRSAAPNSGNGSPSSRGQGEHSNSVSTPSTTQSGINTTTQSIVDPTTVASTTEQDASNNMHFIILNIM